LCKTVGTAPAEVMPMPSNVQGMPYSLETSHGVKLAAFRNVLDKAQALANNQSQPVRNTLEGAEGMSVQDASLLTIGQYPSTVSASDLQRVIALMFFFNAIPSQPSVKAMIFH
jgi:NitT/TauT family transport system substrate-binding protein